MTEQEWLQATDPLAMLEFLRDKASDRKLGLFALAEGTRTPAWWTTFLKIFNRHSTFEALAGETPAWSSGSAAEHVTQVALLRDIFGNPFRPVTITSAILAWNDAAVVRLAQAAYDERQMPEGTLDNGRLAVLADALEEAGCTDADILNHLRGTGPHVRGCWPVDMVLGKI